DGAAVEPGEDDDGAGERAGEIEGAAEGDGVGIGHWILWQSRRRNADGGERGGHGIFAEGVDGLGGGGAQGGSVGTPRGDDAIWNYFGEAGWSAAADDEAVPIFCGREIGVGAAVD